MATSLGEGKPVNGHGNPSSNPGQDFLPFI